MSLLKLKKSGGPRDLEVSMVGARLGSAVLHLSARDTPFIVALAKAVGISGETSVVAASDQEATTVSRAAQAAGVLVDVKTSPLRALPFSTDTFDIAVAFNLLGHLRMNDRVLCLQQVLQVLKPGGRCLVIDVAPRGGLGALLSRRAVDPTYLTNGGAEGALEAEAFRAVRHLANRDGKSYYEGTK